MKTFSKNLLIFIFASSISFCYAGKWAITMEVGVDTWMHISLEKGKICFIGDYHGVSSHPDLRRWVDIYHTTPTSYITFNNSLLTWDMRKPLELGKYIKDKSELKITSVELQACGRPEISMHPNTQDLNMPPDKNRKNNFIVWNANGIKIYDNGLGASPYTLKITLSSPMENSPQGESWINTNHKILSPTRNYNSTPLDQLVSDNDILISQFHRDNFQHLQIHDTQMLLDFQDADKLYAQFQGRSKNRLVHDKFSLFGEPLLEVATFFSPNGNFRSMDFVFYSIDESFTLPSNLFFNLGRKVHNRIVSCLGPSFRNANFAFPAGTNAEQAKWEVWYWRGGEKLIELNIGYEEKSKNNILGRYIYIRISPSDILDSPHMETLSSILHNVVREDDKSVYIKNIPMVNQGLKGYCVEATLSSVLLYMGLDINQYSINLYLINFTKIDSFLKMMNLPFQYYRVDMECPPRESIVGEYNKRKDSEYPPLTASDLSERFGDMKKWIDMSLLGTLCSGNKVYSDFRRNVVYYIDKGIPICWGVHGHVRMIIGYNLDRNEVIYRDSWGKHHVKKHMDFLEAFLTSNEFLIVMPTR